MRQSNLAVMGIMAGWMLVLILGPSRAFADAPPPGEEYPVVWWAQNHVPEALLLFRSTTAETLLTACKSGKIEGVTSVQRAWRAFSEKGRLTFCRSYPGQTHSLLRQAPYFMVRPPGDQR